MNEKRHILFGMTPGSPLQADGHLTDASLLLAIDGELPASDYTLLKEHVRSCWRCRARKEQLERTIDNIVEYEHALVAPDMSSSSGRRAIFMARLDQLAAELGSPLSPRRWALMLVQASRSVFASRVTWGAAVTLIVGAFFYAALKPSIPPVTASELLQRAAVSESNLLAGISEPVIVQKVSIKVDGHKITRTFYHDTVHKRHAQRSEAKGKEELVAERDFEQSQFNWDDPLSPQAYSNWRDGIVNKKDVVTELNGGLLKLDTTSDSGPVAEASLTVRKDDYHAVAEGMRLRDNTRIEVAELSYDVVGLSTLNPEIFGSLLPANSLRLPAVSAALPAPTVPADAAQLAVSELQALAALHGIGADLGEQVTVHPGTDGLVEVDGIAEDETRKRQIEDALMEIPFLEMRLKTFAQVAAPLQLDQVPSNTNLPSTSTVTATIPPLLEKELDKRFPDADQRTEYVNQSLALSQSASARAWALSRLADRYTPAQVALLDTESRKQLETLLNDHLTTLRADVDRLQNQLGKVLSSASNTIVADTVSPEPSSSEAPSHAHDWRDEIHRVHSSVDIVNQSVNALFASSTTDKHDDPEVIELNLRTTLTQLQAELQILDEQISRQL